MHTSIITVITFSLSDILSMSSEMHETCSTNPDASVMEGSSEQPMTVTLHMVVSVWVGQVCLLCLSVHHRLHPPSASLGQFAVGTGS